MQASSSRTAIRPLTRQALRNRLLFSVDSRSLGTMTFLHPSSQSNQQCQSITSRTRCQNHRIQTCRTFFSLPDISKLAGFAPPVGEDGNQIETDGDEQRFHARKILPYTREQLYSLVSDVPSYSSFIPFCNASTVLAPILPSSSSSSTSSGRNSSRRRIVAQDWKPDNQPFEVDAELRVGFDGLEEKYVSKVVGRPFESVTATASEQTPLFKTLVTTWSFSPASPLSPHSSLSSSPPSLENTPSSQLPNATSSTLETNQGPTLLTIDLAFAFVNPLHRIASQAVLPRVADKMVEAFEKRCVEVWGKGKE